MTDADIQKKLDALQKTVQDKGSGGAGWVAAAVAAVVTLASAWYLKYQLAQKQKELAEARTALEQQAERAKEAAAAAQMKVHADEAAEALADAQKQLDAQAGLEKAHQMRVAQLAQIKNWADLNKAAGVK